MKGYEKCLTQYLKIFNNPESLLLLTVTQGSENMANSNSNEIQVLNIALKYLVILIKSTKNWFCFRLINASRLPVRNTLLRSVLTSIFQRLSITFPEVLHSELDYFCRILSKV